MKIMIEFEIDPKKYAKDLSPWMSSLDDEYGGDQDLEEAIAYKVEQDFKHKFSLNDQNAKEIVKEVKKYLECV
jgi:hypothetical protein